MAQDFRKVALVHHIDGGNLGEDATVTAIQESINARWPEAEIIGLAMVREDPRATIKWPISHKTSDSGEVSPDDRATVKARIKSVLPKTSFGYRLLKAMYGVVRGPLGLIKEARFLFRSFRSLRGCDLVVMSVGDQFLEELGHHRVFRNSTWKYAYTIFKWVLIGRIARTKVVLLNVSAGPLLGRAKVLTGLCMRWADVVSFREEESKEKLSSTKSEPRKLVFPDPAYARDLAGVSLNPNTHCKRPVVGISPMILGDPSPRLDSFLGEMSDFTSWLESQGYHVRLFCSNINVDSAALCGIQEILASRNGTQDGTSCLDRVHQWSTEELLANMASLDYVLTSRLHAVIFGQMLGKPVLAISDHSAVRTVMQEAGLSEFLVSIDNCNSKVLREAFTSMVKCRDEVKQRMAQHVAASRKRLTKGFDQIFPPSSGSKEAQAESPETEVLLAD